MTSKKFDLEKSRAKKTLGKLAQSGTSPRFGAASTAAAVDRRERRRLDQAAGLVPFATKLPAALIEALQDEARAQGLNPGEWLARVLPASLPGYHAPTHIQEG